MSYKPIASFSYARKLKAMPAGKMRHFDFGGKTVKAVSPDGFRLDIVDAPAAAAAKIRVIEARGDKLSPYKGQLRVIKSAKKKAKDGRKAAKPRKPKKVVQVTMPQIPDVIPEVEKEKEEKPKPKPEPKPKKPEPEEEPDYTIFRVDPSIRLPGMERKLGTPRVLTEEERQLAKLVPVPDEGLIAPHYAPYIDWENIPESTLVTKEVIYFDHPIKGGPAGIIAALREAFKNNRRYQDVMPSNVLITGPPGTGKSQAIKRLAFETGLPYWQVMGREGLRSDELLGHEKLREGPKGSTVSEWVDGIIPRAFRAGGILHFDEPNVIDEAVLMRLDEGMDDKRQLNMEDLNGEIIKAHPDLFIVFTMNPPDYEGVRALPPPVWNRLLPKFELPFPEPGDEYEIVEAKVRQMGVTKAEYNYEPKTQKLSGKYAGEIKDFIQVIARLRQNKDLTYHPSIRNAIAFVKVIREGHDFATAFDRTVANGYISLDPELYKPAMREALRAVGRSSPY